MVDTSSLTASVNVKGWGYRDVYSILVAQKKPHSIKAWALASGAYVRNKKLNNDACISEEVIDIHRML